MWQVKYSMLLCPAAGEWAGEDSCLYEVLHQAVDRPAGWWPIMEMQMALGRVKGSLIC